MEDQIALSHLLDAESYAKVGNWTALDTSLQLFYTASSSKPNLLIRALLMNAYLASGIIPTPETLLTKQVTIQAAFNENHHHLNDKLNACMSACKYIKAAFQITSKDSVCLSGVFSLIVTCFLDIAGRFLITHGASFSETIKDVVSMSELIKNPPAEWMIIFYMAQCLLLDSRDSKIVFKKALALAGNGELLAKLFFSLIKLMIPDKHLDQVHPKWASDPGIEIYVLIEKLKQSVAISENRTKFQQNIKDLLKKIKSFINLKIKSPVSTHLDMDDALITLSSISIKCEMPTESHQILEKAQSCDYPSHLYVMKQYVLSEQALYKLDKSSKLDLRNRLHILKAVSAAITTACNFQHPTQIISEGCLLVWNSGHHFFSQTIQKLEFIQILENCAFSLELITSPLLELRSLLHLEIAKFYNHQNLIQKAIDHVDKGINLKLEKSYVKYELELLKMIISVKANEYKPNDLNTKGYFQNYLNNVVLLILFQSSESNDIILASKFLNDAINIWITDYEEKKKNLILIKNEIPSPELDSPTELSSNLIMEFMISFYFCEVCISIINRFEANTKNLEIFWKILVVLSNHIIGYNWLNQNPPQYFLKKTAILHMERSTSLIKLYFAGDTDCSNLLPEIKSILSSLISSIEIGSQSKDSWIVHNSAAHIWNFYRNNFIKDNKFSQEWTNTCAKVCEVLTAFEMIDYSIFCNMSAAWAQLLINDYKLQAGDSSKVSKTKGSTKQSKEDSSIVLLNNAESICQDALSKIKCSLESKIYLLSAWCQIMSLKAETICTPIHDLDDITKLFSVLEIAELSPEKKGPSDCRLYLQAAAFQLITISQIPNHIYLESMLRIIQLSLLKEHYSLSFGCIQSFFNKVKSENLQSDKSLCQFIYHAKLLQGQLICNIYTKKMEFKKWSYSCVDALCLFESSLSGFATLQPLDFELIKLNLRGIFFIILNRDESYKDEKIVFKIQEIITQNQVALKYISAQDSHPTHGEYIEILESIVLNIISLCIKNQWSDRALEICELSEKILPASKKEILTLKKYRILNKMGKTSPLIKLSKEQMSQVWFEAAKDATAFEEKKTAFEKSMEIAKNLPNELYIVIQYLEWISATSRLEKNDIFLQRAQFLFEKIEISCGLPVMLLKIRMLSIFAKILPSMDSKMSSISNAKDILLKMLEATHRISTQYINLDNEATNATTEKQAKSNKKPAKDQANSKQISKPISSGEFPKEEDWINYKWPEPIFQCYKKHLLADCLNLKSVTEPLELLKALIDFIQVAVVLKLYNISFIFLRMIELIAVDQSSEILATAAIIEMDILSRLGKTIESKQLFKKFVGFKVAGIKDYGNYLGLGCNMLFIQSKILFKYGHLFNAKEACIDTINHSNRQQEKSIYNKASILLCLIFMFLGESEKGEALVSKIIPNISNPTDLTDACLILFLFKSISSESITLESLHFITTCHDRLKKLTESQSEHEESIQSIFILSWIKLRIIPFVSEILPAQNFDILLKTYNECIMYQSDFKRSIQIDYIKSLGNLLKVENKDVRRKIRNHCIQFIGPIEFELASKDSIDDLDTSLLLELAEIELDEILNPVVSSSERNIMEVLDNYLLDITDPQLKMSKKSCEILLKQNPNNIPIGLRGQYYMVIGIYHESIASEENESIKRKESTDAITQAIPYLYQSKSYKLLRIALEKSITACLIENQTQAFKYLAQLQAIDPVTELRQEWIKFNGLKIDLPILEVLSPWLLKFTQIKASKIHTIIGSKRAAKMIELTEDLKLDLPKTIKLLIIQHTIDKKGVMIGALKRKKDFKKGESCNEIIVIKQDVNDKILENLNELIPSIRKTGVNCNNDETQNEATDAERNVFFKLKEYLEPMSQSKEFVDILKWVTIPKPQSPPVDPKAKADKTKSKKKEEVTTETEIDHLIILNDKVTDEFPLEAYVSDVYGIASCSRDFGLQTLIERYNCINEINEPTNTGKKGEKEDKKKNSPEGEKSFPVIEGVSILSDCYEQIRSIIQNEKKPNTKIQGVSGEIRPLEFNSLWKEYPALVFAGQQFDETVLTRSKFFGPHAAIIFEHDRPFNHGTKNISRDRQRKLGSILTLLGTDVILLTNTKCNKEITLHTISRIVENGGDCNKTATESIQVLSDSRNNHICKMNGFISYGTKIQIKF